MIKIDHMEYMKDMEIIDETIRYKVIDEMEKYDYSSFTPNDVNEALSKDVLSIRDFQALLSPAAEPFLELMAQRAQKETRKHFGNTVYMFTPLYISNYCEN